MTEPGRQTPSGQSLARRDGTFFFTILQAIKTVGSDEPVKSLLSDGFVKFVFSPIHLDNSVSIVSPATGNMDAQRIEAVNGALFADRQADLLMVLVADTDRAELQAMVGPPLHAGQEVNTGH